MHGGIPCDAALPQSKAATLHMEARGVELTSVLAAVSAGIGQEDEQGRMPGGFNTMYSVSARRMLHARCEERI